MKSFIVKIILFVFVFLFFVPQNVSAYWECEWLFGTCTLDEQTYTCLPGQFDEIEEQNCAPITDPGICEEVFSTECPVPPTPFPDVCFQCQTGGACVAVENPFPGNNCNNDIGYYNTEAECQAVCGNNYCCDPDNYSCVIQDENTPLSWSCWGGPTAQGLCNLNCTAPAECGITFFNTHVSGECHFLTCPNDDYTLIGNTPLSKWFGIGASNGYNECLQFGYSCCIPNEDMPLEPRAALSSQGDCGLGAFDTVVGCIQVGPSTLLGAVVNFIAASAPPPTPGGSVMNIVLFYLRFGVGIAGGFSLMLMLYSGILLLLSAGDPEKKKTAREYFISALSGLLLILFSVYLLELIGVQILRLPGF